MRLMRKRSLLQQAGASSLFSTQQQQAAADPGMKIRDTASQVKPTTPVESPPSFLHFPSESLVSGSCARRALFLKEKVQFVFRVQRAMNLCSVVWWWCRAQNLQDDSLCFV